jgi:hypothetical protein
MAYNESTPQKPDMTYAQAVAMMAVIDPLVVPTPAPTMKNILDIAVANQKPYIPQEYTILCDVPLTRVEVQEKLLNSKRLSLPKRLRRIYDDAKTRPLRHGEIKEAYDFLYTHASRIAS